MTERSAPTIGFGVDDVNSERCLKHMEALRDALGYPFQASVIVTNDKEFMNVGRFAELHGSRVNQFAPVVHVSLVTGEESPHDKLHFFGDTGVLHRMLHKREHTPSELQPAHFISHMNNEFHRLLDNNERYVIDEVHRQIDLFERLFRTEANGISYHYGLHKAKRLIGLYAQAARERELPYRFDAGRAGTPRNRHVAVYDGLNYPRASSRRLLFKLAGMKKPGEEMEIMLHFGQHSYGYEQVVIMSDPVVRNAFRRFNFALPSDMWRRVEYPAGTALKAKP